MRKFYARKRELCFVESMVYGYICVHSVSLKLVTTEICMKNRHKKYKSKEKMLSHQHVRT